MLRFGTVTKVYPETGRVQLLYEDTQNTSLPLPLLTMNREYIMPEVGKKVATLHRENGSSRGIVLGEYYGSMKPKETSGYRKDFGGKSYEVCKDDTYELHASDIVFECDYGKIMMEELLRRLERIEDVLGLPHTV